MSLAFPDSLPKPLNGSLSEKAQPAWVQDNSAVGRGRRRNRTTRSLRDWSFQIQCELDQRETLLSFYDVDCVLGVGSFVWTHPSTGELIQVQFSQRPEPNHTELNNYVLSIGLEEL